MAKVVVLGAGPGGYTCAFRLADLGQEVVLIERYPELGGVCLNVGCIPSKALLHMAGVLNETKAMAAHGITFGNPAIDLDKVRQFKNDVVKRLTGGLSQMSKMRKVQVVQGEAQFSSPKTLKTATEEIQFDYAVIAAGSRPVKLPFLPDDPRIIDSTGALELENIPKRMLVIGGGIIGMEMATVYAALGTKISVVELTEFILPGVDRDIATPLYKYVKDRYENIWLNTKVTGAKAKNEGIEVSFEGKDAPKSEIFDKVLVSVGRVPNGKLIGADKAGVHVDERGFIPVDNQQRTNVPHIFAIGDIVGNPMLAHKAIPEGRVAAEVISGKKHFFDPKCIASVAYTDPEVAWVGLTEEQAKAQGINYGKGVFPWIASGRALGLARSEGITKLIFDKETHRVLGAGIVGVHAGDLISEVALAIEMGCEAEDIALTIHPHPTLTESIAIAAELFEGTATDLMNKKERRIMNTYTLIAFIGYLLIVVAIALVAYRMTKNLSDFVLGGRQLGGPVAALSAGASDMSAWLLMGLPGAVFVLGLNQVWLPIGLVLGAYLSWRLIARPLRVYSELANDSLTLPAFLDNRFFDKTGTLRILLALATLSFFAFYTASGLVGGAVLLQRFDISYEQALLIGTGIIVAYTFVGGFLAVSWTDFFQGILMFIFLMMVPFVAAHEFGGWHKLTDMIRAQDPTLLSPFKDFSALLLINLFAWGLGYFGQPHILVRFMAVRTLPDIKIARRICISWMSLSMLGAVLTGFVGIAYFYEQNLHPESIFIVFSQTLFSPWIAGILFAAILSSIMCAIDSQMLASSSALAEDIYHRLLRKKASQKELIWVGRIGIVVISLVAIYLARDKNSTVINLVAFAWAGLGASFGPSVIGALFWRRMTKRGAVAGIILGASSVVIWKLNSGMGGVFSLYEIIPGFFFGSIGVIVGSLLDKPPSQEIVKQFDAAWEKINEKS